MNSALDSIRAALSSFWNWIRKLMPPSSQLQQLENTIPDFREGLNALKAKPPVSTAVNWQKAADDLLENVDYALKVRNAELGWRCFKAADRFTFYGLDEKSLETRASMILNESAGDGKGLPKWRQDTIKKLLTDKDGELKQFQQDETGKLKLLTVEDVVDAKRVLDDHQDNVYRRLSILKSRLAWLTVLGIVFLGVWLLILVPSVPKMSAPSGGSDPLASLGANAATFWWMVVLAGVLGGLISAFTSAIGADIKKSDIPSQLSTQTITFARLVVAALSALAVTLFLTSGILSVKQLSYEIVIVFAIVSGFTDRLLLSAIETVAKPG
jgi:hypothetical protein